MNLPIQKILISEKEIQSRIDAIAEAIHCVYADEEVILLSVLKGAVIFMADLMKRLDLDIEIGFLYLSSYRGETKAQGAVRDYSLPLPSIEGRNVILIEDIYDTGASLAYARNRVAACNPKSLRTCVLLIKQEQNREKPEGIDFYGFIIPPVFVVGYGLDYREKYRQLPYIAIPRF
ncbi:MAG: hypoxanthine phosphoribosyltransferase [Candidatus Omnitrophota bacterium]|jgi:hypoxanthine phosphoribosyltransferase|nr:MAG: hypoxanthine phosphoribosyltransferase [Candidatus Omnitrophota bacterium]